MQPSDCPQCRDIFMADPMLQAEMRHVAIKEGQSAATLDLNERLAERHVKHKQR